jgi:multidrug resistance efflux pump
MVATNQEVPVAISTEPRERGPARGIPENGARGEGQAASAPSWSRQLSALRTIILPAIILGALVVGFFGYLFWLDQTLYVFTDNARVTGTFIQVGSPSAGQVRQLRVDIGDQVSRGQVLASVALAGAPNASLPALQVRAPGDGIVVAVTANPGDMVAAGRPFLTMVDPNGLWVEAQIDETRLGRVRPGQEVEISVDYLARALPGRVISVGAASAAGLTPTTPGATSGFFVKVPQLVPVRIEVDSWGDPPVVGGAATVKIRLD